MFVLNVKCNNCYSVSVQNDVGTVPVQMREES